MEWRLEDVSWVEGCMRRFEDIWETGAKKKIFKFPGLCLTSGKSFCCSSVDVLTQKHFYVLCNILFYVQKAVVCRRMCLSVFSFAKCFFFKFLPFLLLFVCSGSWENMASTSDITFSFRILEASHLVNLVYDGYFFGLRLYCHCNY